MTPGYWRNETSGVLRPAIEAYLSGATMSDEHIAAMRAYLRQWIDAPVWAGSTVSMLRKSVDSLYTRTSIGDWLEVAAEIGIDPL